MNTITIEVGDTRIETPNAILARHVLEQATGLVPRAPEPFACTVETMRLTPTPGIGEFWSGQGGIYAGLMRGENGHPDYHLVVSPAERGEAEAITWGSAGKSEPGATNEWDGLANTRALAESEHSHPAAEWAAGLEINGHRDFYLPSRRELRLCWVNAPELFAEKWYWSSTQYSPNDAWLQDFGDGYQTTIHKFSELRARAVRRVLSTSTL
ncbi:DUF1566 domain-containing protein [Pseudomonas sp. 8Z]|uniref:DUF1566 domain-containing protein n=1 Tax=Pseudomonas sp. 8Z TaxID=2653166 RepID=UPI00135BD785|nr:DUF1566 domain-containing protein [Pseudomonas sp. 8Z]